MGLRGQVVSLLEGRNDTRTRATLRVVAPLVIALFAQYTGFLSIFTLFPWVNGESVSMQQATLVALAIGAVLLVSGGVALLTSSRLDHRTYGSYGFQRSRSWLRDLFGGLAVGVLALVVAILYLVVAGHADIVTTSAATSVGPQTLFPFVAVIVLYLAANVVFEELVFRGIVLKNFAQGLTARSFAPSTAAAGAIVLSAFVFGIWHPVSPGGGGGVDQIFTSAGLGVLLAVAYLLTGNLSFSIGIHLGGGLVFMPLSQEQVLGYALPTVLELTQLSSGFEVTYGILLCRVVSGVVFVLGWVYLTRGEISLDERVLQWKT